jgi:hypothetical protein
LRFSCGWLEPGVRKAADAQVMDIETAYALLAELELHEVGELDDAYFEAELRELLPSA